MREPEKRQRKERADFAIESFCPFCGASFPTPRTLEEHKLMGNRRGACPAPSEHGGISGVSEGGALT